MKYNPCFTFHNVGFATNEGLFDKLPKFVHGKPWICPQQTTKRSKFYDNLVINIYQIA